MKEGALISVYGKPMLAVVKGGKVGELGKRLLATDKSPEQVVEAARRHGIYFLEPAVFSDEAWIHLAVQARKWSSMEGVFNSEKYLGWGSHHYDIQGDDVFYRFLGNEKDKRRPLPRLNRMVRPEEIRRWRN